MADWKDELEAFERGEAGPEALERRLEDPGLAGAEREAILQALALDAALAEAISDDPRACLSDLSALLDQAGPPGRSAEGDRAWQALTAEDAAPPTRPSSSPPPRPAFAWPGLAGIAALFLLAGLGLTLALNERPAPEAAPQSLALKALDRLIQLGGLAALDAEAAAEELDEPARSELLRRSRRLRGYLANRRLGADIQALCALPASSKGEGYTVLAASPGRLHILDERLRPRREPLALPGAPVQALGAFGEEAFFIARRDGAVAIVARADGRILAEETIDAPLIAARGLPGQPALIALGPRGAAVFSRSQGGDLATRRIRFGADAASFGAIDPFGEYLALGAADRRSVQVLDISHPERDPQAWTWRVAGATSSRWLGEERRLQNHHNPDSLVLSVALGRARGRDLVMAIGTDDDELALIHFKSDGQRVPMLFKNAASDAKFGRLIGVSRLAFDAGGRRLALLSRRRPAGLILDLEKSSWRYPELGFGGYSLYDKDMMESLFREHLPRGRTARDVPRLLKEPLLVRGLLHPKASFTHMAFAPDPGMELVTASDDGELIVWRCGILGMSAFPTSDPQQFRIIHTAAYGPSGLLAVVIRERVQRDRAISYVPTRVELWRTKPEESGGRAHPKSTVLLGHDKAVDGIAINAAGDRIATGDEAGTLRIYSSKGLLLATREHRSAIRALRFAGDGALAVGSAAGLSLLSPSGEVLVAFPGPGVTALAARDGRVVIGCEDGSVMSLGPGRAGPLRVLARHPKRVRAVDVRGGKVASGSYEGFKLIDLEDGSEQAIPTPEETWSLALTPDQKLVVSGKGGKLKVYSAEDGLLEFSAQRPSYSGVRSIDLSPDGKRFVIAPYNPQVEVYELDKLEISPPIEVERRDRLAGP